MRHRLLHALIAALVCCAPAEAATVTVSAEGREPATVDVAALQARWDVRDRPYAVGGTTVTVSGLSIDRLLDAAGVDPFGFTGATVAAGSRTVVLDREQLTDPAAFPAGRPVFYPDASGVSFLRPGGELLTAATLTVTMTATSRLRVSASAARTRIEAGERVAFSATVEGGEGEAVRVRWTFDDGESGSGRDVTHRFRRAGTYKVVVGATSDAEPAGASAVVTIRVGDPPEGPDREGGGSDPDAAAPDSGAATGSRDGGSQRGTTRRSGASDGDRAERRRPGRRRAAADRDRAARPARPAAGDRIEGTLIGGTEARPPAAARAARTGSPDEGGPKLPPAAAVALAALGLVGIGALWEGRGRRRRLPA